MHIDLENVSDNQILTHEIIVIAGQIKNSGYKISSLQVSGELFVNHAHTETDYNADMVTPVVGNRFKIIVKLKSDGDNILTFEYRGVFKSINLIYKRDDPVEQKRRIKCVYIIPKDSDGTYQAPNNTHNSKEIACQKITLAAGLIQCFIADGLQSHGLGRKTFQFNDCQIFYSKLTMVESHSKSSQELWEIHAKELLGADIANDNTKVLAVLSATRFINNLGREPKDHDEMMSMTKSHGALGGGGLALFGSGCLYSWPSSLHNVQRAFLNSKATDPLNYMDDSGYRRTYGGCFSTTLGAIAHELGHTLNLGHTDIGIMARGFDDIHKYFTVNPLEEISSSSPSISSDILSPTEENRGHILLSPTSIHRFTSFKQDGANYLQQYQQKRELRKMLVDHGKAFWSRSCALILANHPWLNPQFKNLEHPDDVIRLDGGILTVSKGYKLAVMECRKDDKVLGFLELSNVQNSDYSWDKLEENYPKLNHVLALTTNGIFWQHTYP